MLKNLIHSAFGLALLLSATLANASGFSPDDVVRVDILPGWRTAKGTHMTALRVQLEPGWKTYWRAPGQSGIPPRFDWEGSRNLSAVKFHWPTPSVFNENGLRTVGYKNQLILPMELTPKRRGGDIILRAEVELGVCEDICIPVSLRIAANLGTYQQRDARISTAMSQRPATAKEVRLRAISCAVEPISDGLRVTAQIDMPRLGADEIAVFELPDQTIWVSEASTRRRGGSLWAVSDMVPPSNQPFLLNRSQVRITVMAGGRAVEIWGCKS